MSVNPIRETDASETEEVGVVSARHLSVGDVFRKKTDSALYVVTATETPDAEGDVIPPQIAGFQVGYMTFDPNNPPKKGHIQGVIGCSQIEAVMQGDYTEGGEDSLAVEPSKAGSEWDILVTEKGGAKTRLKSKANSLIEDSDLPADVVAKAAREVADEIDHQYQ